MNANLTPAMRRMPHVPGVLALISMLLLALNASAQIPQTDLYLFQLVQDDTSRWHVHSPQYLSGFNAGGYTNQPEFVTDDMLYVSVRKDGSDQNDIYALDLDQLSVAQVTDTPESEYSPLRRPDQTTFSCVRQVVGDSLDQQVFIYPVDRSDNGFAAFTDLRSVGYHCWLSENELALFLVGDPVRLALANTLEDTYTIYASDIGRCLRRTADGKLAFIHKYRDQFWYLKVLDPKTRRSEIITRSLTGREDFVIGPDGTYFMGDGSELYSFNPARDNTWVPVFDLALFGLDNITRLAVNSRLQLVVVSAKG